ncbi:N-formylglutamate amidohydrolase [Formosa sediminum]|uniref:N-formylglutamate amidohydrolase n=1 Tax=Formosa sediminum TaxID=2594004 RepID=A0A516GTP6_9FLAO|nr:N-formylglutamate amidohydrolase [Formosa sediminum]QDO94899.1 N-formylglutamate amidohydrolase [Formosa sediminum]
MKINKTKSVTAYGMTFLKKVFQTKSVVLCLLTTTVFFQIQCSSKKTTLDKDESLVVKDIFDPSWLEATEGNMPLVISVPHGGLISPTEIPDRTCGTKEKDDNTNFLAYEISDAFEKQGKKPFLIVSQIARAKIDLNRDMDVATCENPMMYSTWKQYHKYIEAAISKAIEQYGYALYIDLHGQSHPVKRLELGYMLRKSDLESNSVSATAINAKSSLQNLLNMTGNQTLKDLLIGEHALGTFFESNGYPAVPSLQDPYPKSDEAYFSGGYNTRRYTSSDYPKVFGLQIEANYKVRASEANRKQFSEAFVTSITDYLDVLQPLIK